MKKSSSTPQAVEDCHQLLLWFVGHIDKFPRSRKFTLGERIESQLLVILEDLVSAGYGFTKVEALTRANIQLASVRHLWRLAFEMKVIPVKSYEHGAKLLLDLGRQVGGWLKQCSHER